MYVDSTVLTHHDCYMALAQNGFVFILLM